MSFLAGKAPVATVADEKPPVDWATFKGNLDKCNQTIEVSSESKFETTTMKQLLAEAAAAGEAVVFTMTGGPFKPGATLPKDWMLDTVDAVGCTDQLKACLNPGPKIRLYGMNKHTTEYLSGGVDSKGGVTQGLIASKGFTGMKMISVTKALEDALGLPTFPKDGNTYLKRFSVVVFPDGTGQVFGIKRPVSANAVAHFAEISACVEKKLGSAVQHKATPPA